MLVPDLAHQLLKNVLHRHNAAGSAVLVDHDGDMRLLLLELLEKPADRLVFQHENRRHENVADGLFRDAAADVKILLQNRAEDMINRVLIDEQPGVFRLVEQRGDFLLARRNRKRRKVDPVNEDVLRLLLGKINRVFEQLSLVFVDAAVLLHLVDEHQQLLLRHFALRVQAEHLCQQLLPERKQKIERRENVKKHLQNRR